MYILKLCTNCMGTKTCPIPKSIFHHPPLRYPIWGGRKNVTVQYFFAFPPPILVRFWKLEGGGGEKYQVLRTYFENTGKTSKCNITFWRLTLKNTRWSVGGTSFFVFFSIFQKRCFTDVKMYCYIFTLPPPLRGWWCIFHYILNICKWFVISTHVGTNSKSFKHCRNTYEPFSWHQLLKQCLKQF